MESMGKTKSFEIVWESRAINDDGKQTDLITGAAHPGCCKQ